MKIIRAIIKSWNKAWDKEKGFYRYLGFYNKFLL